MISGSCGTTSQSSTITVTSEVQYNAPPEGTCRQKVVLSPLYIFTLHSLYALLSWISPTKLNTSSPTIASALLPPRSPLGHLKLLHIATSDGSANPICLRRHQMALWSVTGCDATLQERLAKENSVMLTTWPSAWFFFYAKEQARLSMLSCI